MVRIFFGFFFKRHYDTHNKITRVRFTITVSDTSLTQRGQTASCGAVWTVRRVQNDSCLLLYRVKNNNRSTAKQPVGVNTYTVLHRQAALDSSVSSDSEQVQVTSPSLPTRPVISVTSVRFNTSALSKLGPLPSPVRLSVQGQWADECSVLSVSHRNVTTQSVAEHDLLHGATVQQFLPYMTRNQQLLETSLTFKCKTDLTCGKIDFF